MDEKAGDDDQERASDMEFEVVTDKGSDYPGELEGSPERLCDAGSNAIAVEIERRSMISRKSADRQSAYSASGSRTTRSACRYNRLTQNKVANEIFMTKSETRSKLAVEEVKKEKTLRRLTKKAIEESGIPNNETEKDQMSVTSSAFIRRKINEAAHAALPKSKGDTATKLAETQMEFAK